MNQFGRSMQRLGTAASALVWTFAIVCFCQTPTHADDGVANRQFSAGVTSQRISAAIRSPSEWLIRMNQATQRRAYIGTYVVSSDGNLTGAKLWHVCDGAQQMERIEALTGPPRSTFRHNDRVLTFSPNTKVVRSETRLNAGIFPALIPLSEANIDLFYTANRLGEERVARVDAEIIHLQPKDAWRFGYRIWAEVQTGLVVKMQVVDAGGRVLEQFAFTELQLDAPVKMERLLEMMSNTDGYRVETVDLVSTSAQAEGWDLRRPVPGFVGTNCVRRLLPGGSSGGAKLEAVQWVFSDGLASLSMFIEPYDRQRHGAGAIFNSGATQTLTRRIDEWWLTVVGEVPLRTLRAFADGLIRSK